MMIGYTDVPVADFAELLEVVSAQVRPGRVYTMQISHDDVCPCAGNRAPMPACTCSHVNVTVAELQ